MKILIASDLHGSAYYTRKLLDCIRQEAPDTIVLLGDLLYHGPRNDLPKGYNPKDVIELLSSLSPTPICVRGNCEAEVDQMVLPFPVMDKFRTLTWEGKTVLCTHGHRELPDMKDVDVLLCGHTHIPKYERLQGYVYLNCGSVSIPKENTPHSYMILENGIAVWKDLDGKTFMKTTL